MGIINKPFTLTKQKIEDKLTGLITSHSHVGSGSDELLKVSANDTTADYLENKLVETAGNGIFLDVANEGGNETLSPRIGDHFKQALSTGLISGGVLSIGTPNTTFSISDGSGIIVDGTTVTPVSWTGKTNIAASYVLTNIITFISIDSNGDVVQRVNHPTNNQRRGEVFLGVIVHVNNTFINAIDTEASISLHPAQQVQDLAYAIGFFNVSGNVFGPSGADLTFDKSLGELYFTGSNYDIDPKNPSQKTMAGITDVTFQYRFQNGNNRIGDPNGELVIDPTIWDVGGVETTVSNNKWTIQTIYQFISGDIKLQPGQTEYNSLAAAREGLKTDPFVPEPSMAANGLIRSFLIVKKECTDLSDPSLAEFVEAERFGTSAGAGGLSVSNLQQAYNNSLEPEIVLDSVHNGINIADNATPIGTDFMSFQSNDGLTKYFSVDATGTKFPANGTPTVNYVPVCSNANGSWAWGSPPKGLVDGTGLGAMQSANITGATDGIASGADAIAIGGRNATAFEKATAVGGQTYARNYTACFGYDARAGQSCVAVGYNTYASFMAISIGANSTAGANCISIGNNSLTGTTAIGIGPNSNAQGSFALAVGYQTTAVIDSCSYGGYASAGYRWACSIGKSSTTGGIYGTTLGSFANAAGEYTIAIGGYSKAGSSTDSNTIAIGYNANALNYANSILIGANISATADNQIKIGDSSHTSYIDGVLNVGSDFIQTNQRTITNSTDAGVAGTICHDSNYIYVCTATNTWKRVALATW